MTAFDMASSLQVTGYVSFDCSAKPPQRNVIKVVQRRHVKVSLCVCSAKSPQGNIIKVVVNGAASDVGKAAVVAINRARGLSLAGAVDSLYVGCDSGEIAGLGEPNEVSILNDLVMVLGSLSQSTTSGVMVDFSTDSDKIYDNVRQATAFGMKSIVCAPNLEMEVVAGLSTFCEKASMGCLICPTLSIGRVLLHQAAVAAAYHYASVQIIESQQEKSSPVPSSDAKSLANSLSGLGCVFNQDIVDESAARGAMVGQGVRVHSLLMPGPGLSSMDVRLSASGEALAFRHDLGSVSALMPGLILAIRRVIRLKSLVYGLEKIL